MDNRKIIVAFYLACSGVVWFLTRSAFQYLYLSFYYVRRIPAIQLAREGVPFILGAALFVVLFFHPRANLLLDEVVSELKKVTWPERDEVVRSTTVVIICIIIASFILAGFDLLWGKMVTFLLRG